jgi:uncharacterized membrane-anchored protein YjiN (DUF445 family)
LAPPAAAPNGFAGELYVIILPFLILLSGSHMEIKEQQLAQSKRTASLFLAGASVTYATTLFIPDSFTIQLVRATSEAGMVGAFADWFAVAALFKRIPIPFISNHTEIIPKNKDNIAENLSTFVRDKFFSVDSISDLIRKHDPANSLSIWLKNSSNTERLGTHLVKIFEQILNFVEDDRIQAFIFSAINAVVSKINISQTVGEILGSLTKNNRHQDLLNEGIKQISLILSRRETQEFISRKALPTFQPADQMHQVGASRII